MKAEYKFSGDLPEDLDSLQIIAHSVDIYSANFETKQAIRARRKYEDISEEEQEFLEKLQDLLYVEGVPN